MTGGAPPASGRSCSDPTWNPGTRPGWRTSPWTRIPGVQLPKDGKRLIPQSVIRQIGAEEIRRLTVDGTFGGAYQRSDEEILEVWRTGVAELRELIETGWAERA